MPGEKMNAAAASVPGRQPYLASASERFLARVVQYSLSEGWRTPTDFLRHFGPRTLIRALASDPALRVKVLVAATHVNERLAMRKTDASAAEDLSLALDEGLVDADALLGLIPPEARVAHLDPRRLWSFVTESEFWKLEGADVARRDQMVQRVTAILECALEEGALRLQDIADGIGFKRIATCLPQSELQRVVEHALSRAREGQRLTEEQLLEAVPLRSLMRHVPLEHTWKEVVVERLAKPLALVAGHSGSPPPRRAAPPPPPSRHRTGSRPASFDPSNLPESLLELQRGLLQTEDALEAQLDDDDVMDELTAVTSDDSEETQIHVDVDAPSEADGEVETRVDVKAVRDEEDRHSAETASELVRVRASLEGIGRFPAEAQLSLPVLLSIESMYAELRQSGDPLERHAVVRDAFPNQTHLRLALIALIRVLDPDQRTSDAALIQADSEALIDTLLFEERRLMTTASETVGLSGRHGSIS